MQLASWPALLAVFWDTQIIRWVVWVGLVVLTISLLLLVRTRWGQSQPLSKCVVLSLVAHLLLGIYLTTVNIVTDTVGSPDGKGLQVALVDSSAADAADSRIGDTQPFNGLSGLGPAQGQGPGLDLGAPEPAPPAIGVPEAAEPERAVPREPELPLTPVKPPALPRGEDPMPSATAPDPASTTVVAEPTSPTVEPSEPDPVPPPEPEETPPQQKSDAAGGADARPDRAEQGKSAPHRTDVSPGGGSKLTGSPATSGSPKQLPEAFRLRAGDHTQVAKGYGATPESEAAVTAALRWLAANQSAGGRWDARRLGAGGGRAVDGMDRSGAGTTADTGITGLALLSFLAAGHTHLQGPHQATIRRGLEFLLSSQAADGNLGASQNMYEKMYCHAMATCALSEAYAMTHDERLGPGVRRAIGFTLAAQDPGTGGWRYRPHEQGDTSQLGWQVMALKSAQLAGIQMPDQTRAGIERFLKNVAGGRERGLASYQASRPIPSRSMTAEALVCRQFLDIPDTPAALAEASGFLLQEVPGSSTVNHYYWYYGTLSMYQLQGESWRRWNEALQRTLLASQRSDGAAAGSWDPDPVWGGCGGRAYSTSLATLCLEVYYRFLPLYVEAAGRDRRTK